LNSNAGVRSLCVDIETTSLLTYCLHGIPAVQNSNNDLIEMVKNSLIWIQIFFGQN